MERIAEARSAKLKLILANVFLFFLFSFLGWCMEKVWFFFLYHDNADRGFLRLPFCTIYGTSLLLVRLFLGIPMRRERPYPLNALSLFLYAFWAALAATAAELAIGLFFEEVFGMRLWSYVGYAFSYRDYICLPMSLGWGAMITAAMLLIWSPLERALCRAPVAAVTAADLLLAAALLTDFILLLLAF